MPYRIASAGLLLCSAFFGTGCPGQMCTAMGCVDDMEIVISHGDGGDLADGEYVVEVLLDGAVAETLTCVAGVGSCTDSGSGTVAGNADATSIHVLIWDLEEPPETVEVAVTYGGELLGSLSVEPSWWEEHPNGEDCEPSCWVADDEEMEIARPS